MLQSLHIENFRGFQEFDLENLGRVNLLVGENNSGKTSILEAIQIFCSYGNLNVIVELMNYRSEYFWSEDKINRERQLEYGIRHIFYGHEIREDTQFIIRGLPYNSNTEASLSVYIKPNYNLDDDEDDDNDSEKLGVFDLIIESDQNQSDSEPIKVKLSSNNSMSRDQLRRHRKTSPDRLEKTQLITPFSLEAIELTNLFDNIVLTQDEQLIIEALKIIDPNIERIATVRNTIEYGVFPRRYTVNYGQRGGFVIKFSDQKQPVPIGSLGDGIWRILSIILAMVNLENGVLLVDEIDTGLHFTTLLDMWKVILFTARKLNIQVFATTHNSDCWKSLAKLIKQEEIEENEITIQRIEPDRKKSVSFNPKQIVIAEEREIEVR